MSFIIGALLGVLVTVVVLYPFIKSRFRPSIFPTGDSPAGFGREGRGAIYEDIKTLQLEYDLGRVEDPEYRQRLRDYRLRAASALRDQDGINRELDRSIEEEILSARTGQGNGSSGAVCKSCGRELANTNLDCPYCDAAPASGGVGHQGQEDSDREVG